MSTATAEQQITQGTWKIDTIHSQVGFAVKHMVVSTFRGRFDTYTGALSVDADGALQLDGSVDVDSIAIKDESLAGHLKSPDFFDTASHPQITFSSTAVRIGEDGTLEVDGQLTIKGHTHPVTGRGTLSGPHVDIAGSDKIGVELEASIDRGQYGLDWNAPLPKGGFALSDDVKLQVSLELVREA